MNRWLGGFLIIALSGCVNARLYPVCFYNGSQPTGASRAPFFDGLAHTLRQSLGLDDTQTVSVSPDGRWLVTNANRFQNYSAARVWPRIGCIGSANNSFEVLQEQGCVAYVHQFVKRQNYFAFGNAKDVGGIDIYNESPDPKFDVHCQSAAYDP